MPSLRQLSLLVKRNVIIVSFLLIAFFLFTASSVFNINEAQQDIKSTTNLTASLARNNTVAVRSKTLQLAKEAKLNYNVHMFYYAWYGSPEVDGQWWHWDHEYIPPWDPTDHHKYPKGHHKPPCDIGANFYPLLGAYSSRDPAVLRQQMREVAGAGTGVVALSWYPPGQADEHGPPSDAVVGALLAAAGEEGVKVCLHIEPYEGRGPATLRKHLQYVVTQYGSHPAYYKQRRGTVSLPVFYIYDSYRTPPDQWARLLSKRGDLSVRGTELDALFIGLVVDYKHRLDIKKAGFDGFYTYFASDGFSYGSSWRNWRSLAKFAHQASLLFVPSVGPGYLDTRVRPWNSKNTRSRRGGKYYETAWQRAVETGVKLVSVTSYNEWHEGTQLEPAVVRQCGNYSYQDYSPASPQLYLDLTSKWALALANTSITHPLSPL